MTPVISAARSAQSHLKSNHQSLFTYAADAICERNTDGKILCNKPARKLHQTNLNRVAPGKDPGC